MKVGKKSALKRATIMGISIIIIFSFIFIGITKKNAKEYSKIINENINRVISKVIKEYPEISETDILDIVNSIEPAEENILQKYGYENEVSNIKELKIQMENNITKNVTFIIVFGFSTIAVYTTYIIVQEKKIREINEYMRQVNNRNYILKIEDNKEDELSKLRNELYKTTVLLKEAAENSENEKVNLSNSLADISHQLKTPLTSISIMLDNIQDNPDMDKDIREDFIKEIRKQIDWITTLVISLLKMARFDAGVIKMENKEIIAKELIDNAIGNLSILLEIKNIEVVTLIDENAKFVADYKWQLEAITNILKNAIEHSKQNSKIYITVENTSLFLKIIIRDLGEGIEKEDKKHIFERFYRTKTSKEGSIGIGLPLAKAIIEQNNGYINVDSEINKGTTFEIKYLKR